MEWPTGRGRPINNDGEMLGHAWVDSSDPLVAVGRVYVRARIWAEFPDGGPATVEGWRIDRVDGRPVAQRRKEIEVRPIKVDRGPALRLYLEVRNGRLEVRASEFVTASDDDRGVQSQDLNWASKNLSELIVFAVMATPVYEKPGGEDRDLITEEQDALNDLRNVGLRKYTKWDAVALRKVAQVHQACRDGRPARAVQEAFDLKPAAADKVIARARKYFDEAPTGEVQE